MIQDFTKIMETECSCMQVEVIVTESWLDRFIEQHQVSIPVGDKYHLVNLKNDLDHGKLTLQADIKEKEGSSIRITCLPKWDAGHQRIQLEELKINTSSKNILLKSAGWFAKTFMTSKIDKTIEEATNNLYKEQMNALLSKGLQFPLPNGSKAMVDVTSISIKEMTFLDHSIWVKVMIEGYWKLHLFSKFDT